MPKKLTTEIFIERAKLLHINEITNEPRYDYSLVEYINNKTNVKIICPKEGHGEFMQKPDNHLSSNGCPVCGGTKKLTQEEFIERAQKIHIDEDGNPKYDYSLVEYVGSDSKVIIICQKEGHGEFLQTPDHHLRGQGCLICGEESKKLTQEEFIERAQKIHIDENGNSKYDYSLVKYVNNYTKVEIICPKEGHGKFFQPPNNHLSGNGCILCAGTEKSTTEKFIAKAELVHINEITNEPEYDYSKVIYVDAVTKVIITCLVEEHGDFLQTPNAHLKGEHCPKCYSRNTPVTQQEFVERSQKIHKISDGIPLYDYSKSIYVKHKVKLIIICNKEGHGEFLQTPHSHLTGKGCPKCNLSKGEMKIINFLGNNNLFFFHQYKFDDCRNINSLPFDFYLPEYNLCIEYDGEQHFKSVQFKGSSLEKALIIFEKTKLNDQIKTKYCLNNNINLLRIPYWDFKNIEQILEKELNIAYIKN